MSFKGFSIFRSGCHFVWWSRTILAILEEVTQETFLLHYFEIGPLAYDDVLFKGLSNFVSGGHFVHRSETILAILVEGHQRFFSIFSSGRILPMRVVETTQYWTAANPQKKICNRSSVRNLSLQ